MKPKERLWSRSYARLCLNFCTRLSYRGAASLINTALRRPPETSLKPRTLADFAEANGRGIHDWMASAARTVLEGHRFDPETGLPGEEALIPARRMAPEPLGAQKHAAKIAGIVAEINSDREPRARIRIPGSGFQPDMESPQDDCCYISIDDIGVKHQKESRKDDGLPKNGKYVENTVIHVESHGESHCLTAVGMDEAFRILMAFLLSNGLLQCRSLVFFADGAQSIKCRIEKHFAFRPHALILDWYHLKKKCKELASSGCSYKI
jgi:hypothetical protein